MADRYGRDVLRNDPHKARQQPEPTQVSADPGLVVECASSGFCGAVIRVEKTAEGTAVELEDRQGRRRLFPLRPGAFLLEGRVVTLTRPVASQSAATARVSASGSVLVADAPARVAQGHRIWVEGIHDAELIERVWGHDLRGEGVVVEPLHGADHLLAALADFRPGPQRRVGVLLDHLVAGSKESRLAAEATNKFAPYVEVAGHPFVDVWQAVRPTALGIAQWPVIPPGQEWKAGVIAQLGWRLDASEAWRHILGHVKDYSDLEPALLGRVEQLIDFVTAP